MELCVQFRFISSLGQQEYSPGMENTLELKW
jgi:hypothetical protein